MSARVFRGFDLPSAIARVAGIVVVYAGAFLVLWTAGLAIRGWRGWALMLVPFLFLVGSRLWALRRVSVELADGALRYEGLATRDDFEVSLDAVDRVYFDPSLPGRPLVLVFTDGTERVLPRLARGAADGLRAALVARGARDVHAP